MDGSIFRWVNRLADHTGWAHGFFRFYADAGIVVLAALLLVAFLDGRRRADRREVAGALGAGAAALAGLGLAQVVGGFVDRARPYTTMANVHLLVDRTTDFSFPSDHATVAGAVAVGLLLANRTWGRLAIGAALLMAFTRVYVGAHYPGDVLAGLALGAATALAVHLVVVPVVVRLVERLAPTPVGRLVTVAGPTTER